MYNDEYFYVMDNNIKRKYKIIDMFYDKDTYDCFIIFTEDNKEILASKYIIKDNNICLIAIDKDSDYDIVDRRLKELNGK